jgi:hypothetical protein
MHTEYFEVSERFRGPPRSGNGGYVCGRIARHLRGTVSARLKAPPPLDTQLRLESSADEARLFHDTQLIGEARLAKLDVQAPACPTYEHAEVAAQSYLGFKAHPFPGCFVCGPQRKPGDGLRIFPGALDGGPTIAAPWVPDTSLADESGMVSPVFLWSALDCTGAFTIFPLPGDSAIVLGELCASLTGQIAPGEHCVVIAWPLGTEGRKHIAGSAVYGEHGRLAAVARAVWVEVPLNAWAGRSEE